MNMTLSERIQPPNVIEFSLGVLISRINELPAEDRDDLYTLVRELASAKSKEEVSAIHDAMLEILDQREGKVEPSDIDCVDPDVNSSWKQFIGARVKVARERAGLNQSQVAERSGLPQSHISRIENGVHSPSRKTLEKLASALGIDISELDSINERDSVDES